MSSRTFCHLKLFNSSASSARVSVTACAEAARSSPRKLQSRSQTTLPLPKKGSVCSASRSRAMAFSASPLLETVGLDDFMVHAAEFRAPLLVNFPGAFFNGEFIVAANERRAEGLWRRAFYSAFAAGLVDPVEDLAHVLDLREQRRGNVNRLLLRGGDGQAVAGPRVHLDNFSRATSFCCCKISRAK